MDLDFDYSVHFANIQRVINNIPEPWKTELADTAVDLRGQIKQNHEEMTKLTAEQYREILDSNPVCF